jgi:hypothetical protein
MKALQYPGSDAISYCIRLVLCSHQLIFYLYDVQALQYPGSDARVRYKMLRFMTRSIFITGGGLGGNEI